VFRGTAALLASVSVLALAAPAAADDAEPVRLETTARFGEPAYDSTDVTTAQDGIRFTVTVRNVGAVTAEDVEVRAQTDQFFNPADQGPLFAGDGVVRLAPDEEISVEVPLEVWAPADVLRVRLEARAAGQEQDDADGRHVAVAEAPMTAVRGSLSGVIYGDQDEDGVFDRGEALIGRSLLLAGGFPPWSGMPRADAAGRFHVPDLPAGGYRFLLSPPDGWRIVSGEEVRVGAGPTTVVVRAVREVTPTLSASATLDRDTYAPGDLAREHVVITNTGTRQLDGVVAMCGGQDKNSLRGMTWGELVEGVAPGISLRPGETRTYDFTEVVPEVAGRYGFIVLECRFSSGGVEGARTFDRAAVPGQVGSLAGTLCAPGTDPCAAVPGVSVLLMDNERGRVAGRATSGRDGRFTFVDVPAGLYEVRLLGPWRHGTNAVEQRQVLAGETAEWRFDVVPGPVVADPEAPPPVASPSVAATGGTPPPRAAARPAPAGLADTGADVMELSALGLLLVVAGAALLAVRPRRAGNCVR
jgi:hypothetical protein